MNDLMSEQVANQQGKYLSHLLATTDGNVTKQTVLELQKAAIRPFEYHHFGSFAYVGENKAVLQMPVIGIDDVKVYSMCYTYVYCTASFDILRPIKGLHTGVFQRGPIGWSKIL